MRETRLNQATAAVVLVLICAAVTASVWRAAAGPKPQKGVLLFSEKGCDRCHYTESTMTKIGPGLKDLLAGEKLPASGRAATAENVKKQLRDPFKNMPSFAGRLSEEERELLVDYLKTL